MSAIGIKKKVEFNARNKRVYNAKQCNIAFANFNRSIVPHLIIADCFNFFSLIEQSRTAVMSYYKDNETELIEAIKTAKTISGHLKFETPARQEKVLSLFSSYKKEIIDLMIAGGYATEEDFKIQAPAPVAPKKVRKGLNLEAKKVVNVTTGEVYESIYAAAAALTNCIQKKNSLRSSICKALKGKQKTAGGCVWMYA
jgi:hypothetical protein